METTTPSRLPRRTCMRGAHGLMLAAFCSLAGLAAIGWVAGTAASKPALAPSGSVAVTQVLLRPGTIAFRLWNDSVHTVTIAQIAVNDAFWPFMATPRTTLAPHATAVVMLSYPWDAGVAYEARFILSTGATFVTSIAATTTAAAAPSP